MRNGAAAGADRAHIEGGGAHRQIADRGVAPGLRDTAPDQADIGRCAAHVESQEIVETRLAGDPQRPGDAAGGTAHQEVDRHRLGAGRRLQWIVRHVEG